MEDAKISGQEAPQGLYQRGKFPSVIDTDDLVFEMGVQLVGNLNKEKLLNKMMERAAALEKAIAEAMKAKAAAEEKVAPLSESNKLYIENNQRLDDELVKIREEVEALKSENKSLGAELVKVRADYEQEIADLKKKKTKPSKKKD